MELFPLFQRNYFALKLRKSKFVSGRKRQAPPEDHAEAEAGPDQAGGREQEDFFQQLPRHPPGPRPQQQRCITGGHAGHSLQTTQVTCGYLTVQSLQGTFGCILGRAVDLHSFFADPDPAVFLNADPDPAA